MHFLPKQFFGIDRPSFLILMSYCYYALHGKILWNGKCVTHNVLSRSAVCCKTVANLNPARTEPQFFRLKLHEHGCNRGIFHKTVAQGRIGSDNYGKRRGRHRLSSKILAGSKPVESIFVFYYHKLPRAFAF